MARRQIAPVTYEQTFPPEPSSAPQARRFVRACLQPHGLNSEAAELVTAELVGNVVAHAHTAFSVAVLVGDAVRVEVRDGNAVIPAIAEAAEDAEHGRGLFLVEAFASSWGIDAHAEGKAIWVEMPAERQTTVV